MAKTKLHTFYMSLLRDPIKAHVQDLVVTWMLSSNLWRTNSQRSGQVNYTVLPRGSQVSRVCVASV